MEAKRCLILKTGDTLDDVKSRVGDFDAMFLEGLRGLPVEAKVVSVHKGEALPERAGADAILVTGSPHSVTEREAWADGLAGYLRDAVEAGTPVLGVCYGHQILAHALGGRVERNPAGYEVGTVNVVLTAEGLADPLLGPATNGAREVPFHSTHVDAVTELPPSARILASTPTTAVQAFAVGTRAWGVQFHPEFNETVMSVYIEKRRPLIEREAERLGLDPAVAVERARASVRPAPAGRAIFRRFMEIVRGAHR